jgi:fumarate reductase (CoM/CoB) subunit B
MRVIDALHQIKLELDPTLGYNYSCDGRKRCGTCAVMINGRPRLACFTILKRDITIEPLRGFPVIKDLIIDRSHYEERKRSIEPAVQPDRNRGNTQPFDRESQSLSHCIECLCCQAACPVASVETWKNFLGPAVLVQLGKVSFDPRDHLERVKIVMDQGIHNCDKCYECEKSCPVDIEIVRAIQRFQQSARRSDSQYAGKSPRALMQLVEGVI